MIPVNIDISLASDFYIVGAAPRRDGFLNILRGEAPILQIN